jgi:single-stranded-DNA-specific exonuclease
LLINYGGHEMAAGLTIAAENIDAFRERITQVYHEMVHIPPTPTLKIDFEVEKPELLELRNVESISMLEPFGNGFLPPVLCLRAVRLTAAYPVGGGKHTRMRVEKRGVTLDCIFFSNELRTLGVSEGDIVDVAFEPLVNEFRKWRNVQLRIADIRPHQ